MQQVLELVSCVSIGALSAHRGILSTMRPATASPSRHSEVQAPAHPLSFLK